MLNKILWAVATALILINGVYFTHKLKFKQFKIKKILKAVLSKEKYQGINPISSLILTLAGKIGVGSIAGMSLAIYIGGPGTIFWMWIISLISGINTYAESYLGIKYKEKDGMHYKGGPSYYINKGLKLKKLALLVSFIIIICYLIGFVPIQTNTIVKAINLNLHINPFLIGLFITVCSSLIIFGGLKKISNMTNKIVPFMAVLYLIIALLVIIKNINIMPNIFLNIFKSAFNFKPFFTGFLANLIIGAQRGIFASESGLGTGSIASSVTESNNAEKVGLIQIFGTYITTFLICTSTAIIILTSNYQELSFLDINGIELTMHAFNYHFGNLGYYALLISIILFAFSTILTGYYYIESNIKFLFKKPNLVLIKILTLIFLFVGSLISSIKLWFISDTLIAILAIINMYALIKLKNDIK